MVQEVEFVWKGQGSNILLSGDFLNWETQLPLEKSSDGWFVLKQVCHSIRMLVSYDKSSSCTHFLPLSTATFFDNAL